MVSSVILLSIFVSFLIFLLINVFSKRTFQLTHYLLAYILLVLFCTDIKAQSDTVVSYDAKAHKITGQYSVPFDALKKFDFTGSSKGSIGGFTELSLVKPQNTPPNSGFTEIVPAHQFFPVTNYPIRTAVKLFIFQNDSLKQCCSGTLIGRNLVLTAEHCICSQDTVDGHNIYYDSMYVIPAYDNKQAQDIFGGSVSSKYYIIKNGFKSFYGYDIAIMELEKPLGDKTGWMGIAYSGDDSFFKDNIFHKFSYPGTRHVIDTTRIYNGDTLYYNYGTLGLINNNALGYNLWAIPGQSGSSLFYTDNSSYYIFGVLNWSAMSQHIRIENKLFYSLKNIIEGASTRTGDHIAAVSDYKLFDAYPNPFNPATTISYSVPDQSSVELKIFDMLGREISTLVNKEQGPGEYKVLFNASDLPSGIYIYTIQAGQFRDSKKLVLLK